MKFLILFIFYSSLCFSSSFQECKYELKVVKITKTLVEFEIIKQDKSHDCKKSQLFSVARKEISSGQKNLTKGEIVHAEMLKYGAMGPNGFVSGVRWEITNKKNTK